MTTQTKTPPAPPESDKPELAPEDEVMDLTSLVPTRQLVKIPTKAHPEGERFELRLLDDFGIQMQQQLLAWSRRYEELYNSDRALKQGEQDRLKKLLDDMLDEVLDAPVAVKRALPDGVRHRVVRAFSWAPQLALQQAALREREKQILTQLVERELVTQEQLDEVIREIDTKKSTSEN